MDYWNHIWQGRSLSYQDDEEDQEFDVDHLIDQGSEVAEFMRNLPHQALEAPKVHDLRRAAATFTWRTGVGVDGLSPRAFSLLSDEALAQVVYLIWAAET
eukprot:1468961-Pyramimonas_sp.AAC.1